MAVSCVWAMTASVTETLADGSLGSSANSVQHTAFNEGATINASSTPPATKVAEAVVALSGGAKTVDLTALTGTNGATIDMSGLKVQIIRIKNLGANAMTFVEGASNGYELMGNAWSVILASGQVLMLYGNDATPDVAAGAKTIDVTGTTTQTFELTVVAG